MKNILLSAFLIISFNLSLFSQEEKSMNPANIKFNMLSLFDPLSAYQFSFEHGIGGRFNLQYEFGYITHQTPLYYAGDRKLNGFRLKGEIRYFFDNSSHTRSGFYTSCEAMWNQYDIIKEEEFWMQDGAYTQLMEVTKNKKVFAFHQKLGYQVGIDNSRAVFDFYIGLGMRSVYSNVNYPEDGSIMTSSIDFFDYWGDDEKFSVRPSFTFGYKLGIYLFK